MARVLLISGSTRSTSTNSAFVRTAALCTPDAVVYDGLDRLPHFNPDLDTEPLPAEVAELRAAIDGADAVLFCTPEYAGTLPGSFKNLLDWCVGGTVMTDKPVAWVNVAADPRRGGGAAATLATVLGYVQARIVEQACVHIPSDLPEAEVRTRATALLRDLVTARPF
jgi:chromate reductase, NAD(P)H dehydrogenase (quinone)